MHLFTSKNVIEEEKRRSKRIDIRQEINYEILKVPVESDCAKVGDSHKGFTINLSSGGLLSENEVEAGSGGLLIETDCGMPEGSQIKAQLALPMPGYSASFVVEGFVVRTIKKDDLFHIAIAFSKILEHQFNKIKLDIIKEMFNI